MAKRICQNCGKGIMRGHKVSHSKQRTKKIYKPNLHWTKIMGKRMLLCTKCIKRLKKEAISGKAVGA